ncbi:MAG: hypothetical protein WAW80_04980 [Candidatus Saccharimonadales bacterium]
MDNTEITTNTVQWIITHKIIVTLLSVGFIVIPFCVNFLINNAFVYVEAKASFETKNIATYAVSSRPTQKVGGTGLIIVPRDTTSLIVTNDEYIKTELKINIPWYGYIDKKIQLQQDKNATKVAYKSTSGAECATYNPASDRLAYYQCKNPKNIVTYDVSANGNWRSRELAKVYFTDGRVSPYLGGVIGISHSEYTDAETTNLGNIIVVNSAGKTHTLSAPDGVEISELNQARLFTNVYDPTDDRIIIVIANGDIFIGKPTSAGSVDYHLINHPKDYNQDYNQTLCTINRDAANCYQGPNAYGDIRKDFDFSKVTASQIISYNFAEGSEKTRKLKTNLFALDNIQTDVRGEVFGTSFRRLYQFLKEGDSYITEIVSQNTTMISGGDELYYIQDKGVYMIDNTLQSSSHQIFYSPNITPKSIYTVAGKVFIIGTAAKDTSTTYAYLLNSNLNTTPGARLIDLLPSKSTLFQGNVSGIDFIDSKLLVRLVVPRDLRSIKNKELVEEAKIKALDTLQTLGVTTSIEDIVFTY